MEYENDNDTNCNGCTRYSHQRIHTKTGVVGNKTTSANHPNYSIIKIDKNTEKIPGLFRRFAVTQTPLRSYQLTQM